MKTLLSIVTALCLNLPAAAAEDPSHYRLSAETLRKLQAAHEETKQLAKEQDGGDADDDEFDDQADEADVVEDGNETEEGPGGDADDSGGRKDESPEGIARKIDADPKLKALLQRHGIGSMEYAMSVHAMLHAGMFLMFEQSMPAAKARELYEGYTSAQQANIELLRKSAVLKK